MFCRLSGPRTGGAVDVVEICALCCLGCAVRAFCSFSQLELGLCCVVCVCVVCLCCLGCAVRAFCSFFSIGAWAVLCAIKRASPPPTLLQASFPLSAAAQLHLPDQTSVSKKLKVDLLFYPFQCESAVQCDQELLHQSNRVLDLI